MASDQPSVSIVVLNWNGRRYLKPCLESLLALDFPASKLEIILCDNGSTDGSADYVQKNFASVRVVALDRNYGFAEGNNRAAKVASGEWIGFLNNDMRVGRSWLKDLLSGIDEKPTAVCLASRILNWDGSAVDFAGGGINYQGHGFQVGRGTPQPGHDDPRRLLFACGGAMLIRKDVFVEVGGFDERFFAFFEDVDLGWRLNLLGYDVWYVPVAAALHRHHGTARKIQPHRLQVLYERNALAMIYKCFDDQNLAAALPAALMLLNERALSVSGLDQGQFMIGAFDQPRTADGQEEASVAGSPTRASIFVRGMRLLRQDGLRITATMAAGWVLSLMAGFFLWMRDQFRPTLLMVPGVAVSHYVGVSQFAHMLRSLNETRAWVQERRKRTDAEILPLFVNPLYAQYPDEQYVRFYRWLNRVLELDKRFLVMPD